jgi:hypothetical protein
VLGHGKLILRGAGASPNMHSMLPHGHTSRTSLPHPEFCYELSMGCALSACHLLESSVWCVEAVGTFSSGPGHIVCRIAEGQAD